MAQTETEIKRWAVYKCPECNLGNFTRAEPEQRGDCGRCGTSLQGVEAVSPVTVEDPSEHILAFSASLATVGKRFGARFFDGLIFGGISYIVVSVVTAVGGFEALLLTLLGIFILSLVNDWVLVVLRGQSIGKMAMSIRVADDTTGENPSWGAAFVRMLVQQIPIVNIIESLWALWDPRRQALHDKAARTLVVNTS